MRHLSTIALLAALAAAGSSAHADVIDDARALIDEGDLAQARALLAKQPNNADAVLMLGHLDMLDYDFQSASDRFNRYRTLLKKQKKTPHATLDLDEDRALAAINFLDRVEDIVVIDSIAVPKKDFFHAYRLPMSAGRLVDASRIPFADARSTTDMAFLSENGDYMMWAQPDGSFSTLRAATRLTDGTWVLEDSEKDSESEESTLSELASESNAAYPFMMPDGTTLYYASDGDGSIGGYDLFVAMRDASTGEYLQPQNLGMPYNSPYDDYMLAIDEENGIGWFATDRNRLGDDLTIYVYLTSDMRRNCDPDADDIVERARIADYRSSWGDQDHSDKARLARSIPQPADTKEESFRIPMPGGKVLTSIDDVKKPAAKKALAVYLTAAEEQQKLEERLDTERRRYHAGNKNLKTSIATLEKQVATGRDNVKTLLSNFYKALD